MKKMSKKFMAGLVLGVMALSMMFGIAFSTLGQPTASAAPADQTSQTAPTATNPTNPISGTKGTRPNAGAMTEIVASFKKNFAAQLGIDEAKLDSSYSSAVNATVDQAVKDGKLTQAQADKIKEAAKNGFKGFPGGKADGDKGAKGQGMRGEGLDAAAKAIGITSDELKTQLQAGKSIAEVAQSKNVDIQKVKDAMLAEVKAKLDQAVKDGKLTQAQADTAYTAAKQRIDNAVNAKHDGTQQPGGRGGRGGNR